MFELQIKPCHSDDVETISTYLEENNALSITLIDQEDEPIFEPKPGETPLWQYSIIEALYATAIEAEAAKQALSRDYPDLLYTLKAVPHQDWVRTTLDTLKPLLFGKNLWVCPTSHTVPHPNATQIILDPGLAFGTGSHPTTSLCLTWLDGACLHDKTLIDYGCGSGILAIAALKLGARLVYAVDIDEQALTATQNNAEKNGVTLEKCVLSAPEVLSEPVDVLLANILLSPLLTLQSRFSDLLKPGGMLVLSGILKTQVEALINAYHTSDWIHQDTQYEGDWALVIFQKTN